MGEVMGMGSTHWPAMIQPDEAKPWPFLRTLAHDPRVPEGLKHPRNWPEEVRQEYGDDEGGSAHREHSTMQSRPEIAKWLAGGYLEAGVDMAYA